MTEHATRVVVIGAGYAGLLATVRLAGKTRRQNVAITLVNASDVFIERLRLHQVAANQSITSRSIADVLRGTGVNFAQGLVTSIDIARREVVAQTSAGPHRIGYDHLIYALGSTIDCDAVPGVRAHAYTLASSGPQSAVALRAALPVVNEAGGAFVAICGDMTRRTYGAGSCHLPARRLASVDSLRVASLPRTTHNAAAAVDSRYLVH
ncbi:MAG: FAD-dependent oxidoreductase [Chloroflexota bacterium]